jgi:hypothetical protein
MEQVTCGIYAKGREANESYPIGYPWDSGWICMRQEKSD